MDQLIKNPPAIQETPVRFLGWEDLLEKGQTTSPVFSGFPGGSDGEESTCNAGHLGLIPGLGRFPGEGNSYPLQYSGLENSMDRGAWQATVHGVAELDDRVTFTSLHPQTLALIQEFLTQDFILE